MWIFLKKIMDSHNFLFCAHANRYLSVLSRVSTEYMSAILYVLEAVELIMLLFIHGAICAVYSNNNNDNKCLNFIQRVCHSGILMLSLSRLDS